MVVIVKQERGIGCRFENRLDARVSENELQNSCQGCDAVDMISRMKILQNICLGGADNLGKVYTRLLACTYV